VCHLDDAGTRGEIFDRSLDGSEVVGRVGHLRAIIRRRDRRSGSVKKNDWR
jgi:hypothetical protein